MPKQLQFKIASANLNQTISNFTRNVPNIEAAIDAAVEDGTHVLSLQELGLTGYTGDDEFKWCRTEKQQREILELVQHIAAYADSKDPNLVISLGFPLFYADKDQPVKINLGSEDEPHRINNPLYNINDRPFNAQALISGGKVHGISLKTIQPDGAAEYEPRQFTSWHDSLPVQRITLPLIGEVPVGNVVFQLRDTQGNKANLYQEICAEGWPGIYDDGSVNKREVDEGRHLNDIVKKHDISLIINPSCSKPEPHLDKVSLRAKLCEIGSKIANDAAYLYTNALGLEAGPAAMEGGSIFVENGKHVHSSRRYSMADVEYASRVVSMPASERGTPDAVIEHDFSANTHKSQTRGGPAPWEALKDQDTRRAEETMRNTALWIRDYLKKTGLQGFIISLSGGADSAYGAVMVSQAIDLNIKQLEEITGNKKDAIRTFVAQFPHLKYGKKVLDTLDKQGADAAADELKNNLLTCIYLPSDNSGAVTLNAAKTLIEGGMVGGRHVKGIGGKFEVVNVQDSVDALIHAFAGVVKKDIRGVMIDDPDDQNKPPRQISLKDRLETEFAQYVAGTRQQFSANVEAAINHKESNRRLSWNNPEDDITLQNIQARARQPYPWMFANKEHKIACVTSNWSEAVAGYWTFGGDGHMGAINLCGGVPKSHLRKMLSYLEHHGLKGMGPIAALNPVNVQIPTAELRPTAQSDEADMMPYKMLDAIGESIFFHKNTPLEAYRKLQTARDPEDNSKLLFATHNDPNEPDKKYLLSCIEKACKMWHRSQFKRVASVITPFLGQNVDPHTSVRTTIIGDGFSTELAKLKIAYLQDTLGNDFKARTGFQAEELELRARIDGNVRDVVLSTPLEDLPAAILASSQRSYQRPAIAVGGI